jgi:hypothetical protein
MLLYTGKTVEAGKSSRPDPYPRVPQAGRCKKARLFAEPGEASKTYQIT